MTPTNAAALIAGQLFDARDNGYPCEVISARVVPGTVARLIDIRYRRLTDGRIFCDSMHPDHAVSLYDLASALDVMPETMGLTIDADAYSAACDERSYGEDCDDQREPAPAPTNDDDEAQRVAWHARIDAARARSNRRHGITTDAYKGTNARNAVASIIRAARFAAARPAPTRRTSLSHAAPHSARAQTPMTYYTIRNAEGAALGRPSLSAPLAYGPDYCASAFSERADAERVARTYGGAVHTHQTPPIPDRPTCRYCGRAIGLSSFGCDC